MTPKKKVGEIRAVNRSSQAACARAFACLRGKAAGSKIRTRWIINRRARERSQHEPIERARLLVFKKLVRVS